MYVVAVMAKDYPRLIFQLYVSEMYFHAQETLGVFYLLYMQGLFTNICMYIYIHTYVFVRCSLVLPVLRWGYTYAPNWWKFVKYNGMH